jgi:hypothetical protein
MCHHQGAGMRLLSYVSLQGVADKILMVLSNVYYVAAWRVSVCPVMLPRAYVHGSIYSSVEVISFCNVLCKKLCVNNTYRNNELRNFNLLALEFGI